MANYYATLQVGPRQTARVFDYDANAQELVATDARVEFETGSDYFAIKVLGDYSFIYDSDGVLCGDFQSSTPPQYPRLDFYCQTCGLNQRMASLTADGRLAARAVVQSNILPAGMNLWNEAVFTPAGLTARNVNEVCFLAHDGDYVVTEAGLLIRVRTALEA